MTPFQLSAAVAFWVSVWSASLFPVQTESHRRKLCLPSWAPQSEPCEVSRPQRHMFGISASIWIELSRYMLKEPNPYRPKQEHAHIWFTSMPSPAVWAYSNRLISTDLGTKKWKAELLFQGRLRIVQRDEGKAADSLTHRWWMSAQKFHQTVQIIFPCL